ncbi:aldo/keto reductase [Nocardia sp. NBC_01730]|uniref:aldo/keto reductase n=1 Tax=Nocardia sp. NBC_01730 TaxID=2975998 RepID=UPI002E1400AA|nr:aldo/keto reductase [Nocardia sp. NBC_01730]
MVAVRRLGRAGLVVGPHSLGGAQLGNLDGPLTEADWRGIITTAWDFGVRYIDTAPHYGLGLSEQRLGEYLPNLPREEVLISTKVGRLLLPSTIDGWDSEGFAVPANHLRVFDFSRDGILRSLETSLDRLRLERIDIVFVHDPDKHYRQALTEAFPTLEELRSQGVIRSYGAGMNQTAMLTDFVHHTDLDVVLVAGRYTLLDQTALNDLLPLCEARGVSVVAAGVFNSGLLATPTPSPTATYDYKPTPVELLVRARRIAEVCALHDTTLPAAAAQFPLTHPAIATVCLGARTPDQVKRNARLFAETVPDSVWADLKAERLLRDDTPVHTKSLTREVR